MKTDTQLILAPDVYDSQIEIVAEAMELQAAAIRTAEGITEISDAFDANCAGDALEELKQLEKRITDSHKEVKAPYLAMTRKLDEIKRDYLGPIADQRSRIGKLLGSFQAAERDKQRKAEAEARRKEREILDREREKQMEAMTSGDEAALAKSDEAIKTEVGKVRAEASQAHEAVKGVRVRKSIKFEIEDEAELLKQRPDLFSPDDKKIRAALKITQSIPGLKVWEETTAY